MVANAGVSHFGSVLDSKSSTCVALWTAHECRAAKLDDYKHVMGINAQGVFLCYKHAGLQMVEQGRGGRIIGT